MEALWKLEDKWKVTTQEALLLFVCTASILLALCTATILRRKAHAARSQRTAPGKDEGNERSAGSWVTVRKVLLMGSMRWNGENKWEEEEEEERPPTPPRPQLSGLERCESSVGRQSFNSVAAVWQRPILMGDKCELPRFSGLILYDDKGHPLHPSLPLSPTQNMDEEKAANVRRTTLKDLL